MLKLKTSWLTNPFYIYIVSFTIVFFAYNLRWSSAFPPISASVKIFFAITFFLSFLFAYPVTLVKKKIVFNIQSSRFNLVALFLILFGYILEFIYNGGIPILLVIKGTSYSYDAFGIPTFHVLLHTYTSFYGVYLFHQYLSTKSRKVFFYFLCSLIPHLLIVNRGSLMMVLVSVLFVFLLSIKTLKVKNLVIIFLLLSIVLYFFGYLGNIRSANGDSAFIPKVSAATDNFLNNRIPNEYFWTYAYIASPMANFQNNIDKRHPQPSISNCICFIKDELLFDFVAKRLPNINACDRKVDLIFPHFNVSTIYAPSYSLLGWYGPVVLFLYTLVVTFSYLILISSKSKYYVTGLAILLTIFVYNTFANMWSFSGLSFQLIYPFIGSLLLKRKKELGFIAIKND